MALQWSHTPQGLGGRSAFAVGPDAIEGAGDDACGRRLADAADAGQHEGMGEASRPDGVGQGTHQRILADQSGEVGRTIFPGEHAIRGGG